MVLLSIYIGTFYYENEDKYEGEFVEDKRSGHGNNSFDR